MTETSRMIRTVGWVGPRSGTLLIIWSAVLAVSLAWNLYVQHEMVLATARLQAEVGFNHDLVYREWVARQGGVYVRASDYTPPNPYLTVSDRDLTTSDQIPLTLVNPAYMSRQVFDLARDEFGMRKHLVSLRPLNPANTPDGWEAKALLSFEEGAREATTKAEVDGQDVLRFMRPFIAEKACLKCHGAQGYQEGDVRGGISVLVPLAPMWRMEQKHTNGLAAAHALIWLVGAAGIGLSRRRLRRQELEKARADQELRLSEERLRQANEDLERKVGERTAELSARASQLRALAGELTLTEQRERRRMAILVHEHLQQMLVGAKLRLSVAGRRPGGDLGAELREVEGLVDESLDTARSLCTDLSPPILHQGGLVVALQWLARWAWEHHRLEVRLRAEGPEPPLAGDVKVLVFEATRELLLNVARHARVQSAEVLVERQADGGVRITVADEGPGFDPDSLAPAGREGGFGLFSIRERIGLIGGRLELDTAPGRGCRVSLVAPPEA